MNEVFGTFSNRDLPLTYTVGSLKSAIETIEKVMKYVQS